MEKKKKSILIFTILLSITLAISGCSKGVTIKGQGSKEAKTAGVPANQKNVTGITMGNLNNHGEMNKMERWTIYWNIRKDLHLYKTKGSLGEGEEITNDGGSYINAYNGWIYYYNHERFAIYKIRPDGTGKKKILSGNLYYMCLYNGWIYYISSDDYIYKVKTDGTMKTKVSNDLARMINIQDNRIYYINDNFYWKGGTGKLYSIDINGKDKKQITDVRIDSFLVDGKYIYTLEFPKVSNKDKPWDILYRTNLKNHKKEKIISKLILPYNKLGDKIFYNYNSCLYSINEDGTGKRLIKKNVILMDILTAGSDVYYYEFITEGDTGVTKLSKADLK